MKIQDFKKRKQNKNKITMVTCYDYTFAQLLSQTEVDLLLVGDSAAMVMHGFESTVSATMDMMEMHTRMVARGAGKKTVVGDLPFLSYRQGQEQAMQCISRLMQAGAQMIKLEGCEGNESLIRYCMESGVPVMGHLGLTPQLIHQLGGFKVQGKAPEAAEKLLDEAKRVEQAGAAALVLECVPSSCAQMITDTLDIPVIGIGAGLEVDGQVLVLQDLLGMNPNFTPKFLKTYLNGAEQIQQAINAFVDEVQQETFPEACHSYV